MQQYYRVRVDCNVDVCQVRKEQLMLRANSLKRAVRQLIEHTEKMVDDQNKQQSTTTNPPSLKMDTLKVCCHDFNLVIKGVYWQEKARKSEICGTFSLVGKSLRISVHLILSQKNYWPSLSSGATDQHQLLLATHHLLPFSSKNVSVVIKLQKLQMPILMFKI